MTDINTLSKSLLIFGKNARYYDFTEGGLSNGDGSNNEAERPCAHFYGGNGFAAGVYQPLLDELGEQFNLTSLAMRGYWYDKPTANILTREQDADALIIFLEKMYSQPVVGIGHSQGATATAIAAAKRPDLFSSLYLIEPVTFTKAQTLFYNLMPRRVKLGQEPFKSTLSKQADWDSIQQYYEFLRNHRAFKRLSDEHLFIFAQNSLVKNNSGGYSLLFSPEQELASYFGTPYINGALKQLNKVNLPYTLIIGKPTIFISDKVRACWKSIVPNQQIITLPKFGHLLPMEAPIECAQLISSRHFKPVGE